MQSGYVIISNNELYITTITVLIWYVLWNLQCIFIGSLVFVWCFMISHENADVIKK